MVGIILGIVVYLIFFFGVVLVSALAEDYDIIDDKEYYIIMGIFVPPAVLVLIGGLWLADRITNGPSQLL